MVDLAAIAFSQGGRQGGGEAIPEAGEFGSHGFRYFIGSNGAGVFTEGHMELAGAAPFNAKAGDGLGVKNLVGETEPAEIVGQTVAPLDKRQLIRCFGGDALTLKLAQGRLGFAQDHPFREAIELSQFN